MRRLEIRGRNCGLMCLILGVDLYWGIHWIGELDIPLMATTLACTAVSPVSSNFSLSLKIPYIRRILTNCRNGSRSSQWRSHENRYGRPPRKQYLATLPLRLRSLFRRHLHSIKFRHRHKNGSMVNASSRRLPSFLIHFSTRRRFDDPCGHYSTSENCAGHC